MKPLGLGITMNISTSHSSHICAKAWTLSRHLTQAAPAGAIRWAERISATKSQTSTQTELKTEKSSLSQRKFHTFHVKELNVF